MPTAAGESSSASAAQPVARTAGGIGRSQRADLMMIERVRVFASPRPQGEKVFKASLKTVIRDVREREEVFAVVYLEGHHSPARVDGCNYP